MAGTTTAAPTPSPASQKLPGERLADFFNNFFTTVVGISTFGASLTFASVIREPVTPTINYNISAATVQTYLAISWLLFALTLAITSVAASALSLYRPQAISYFGTNKSDSRTIVLWYATFVSALLFGILITAFLFLGLVVAAYAGPVGWAAVGFTVFFGAAGLASIIWQSPLGSGSKSPGYNMRRDSSSRWRGNMQMDGFLMTEKDVRTGPILTGDGAYLVNEGTVVRTRFVDEGLGRRVSVARPLSGGIPAYTADLRRMRAAGKTSEEPRHVERNQQAQQGLESPETEFSCDEKDQSIPSSEGRYINEGNPEIWIPAPQPRDVNQEYGRYDGRR